MSITKSESKSQFKSNQIILLSHNIHITWQNGNTWAAQKSHKALTAVQLAQSDQDYSVSLFTQAPSHLQSGLQWSTRLLGCTCNFLCRRQHNHSEEKWTCFAAVIQVRLIWRPSFVLAAPFPAPVTVVWDHMDLGHWLFPDECSSEQVILEKVWFAGRMDSSDYRTCVGMTILYSFTDCESQFLVYFSTVQRSRCRVWCESMLRLDCFFL